MKIVKYFFLFIIILFVIGYFGVKDAFFVVNRTTSSNPIYTIGDKNYEKALKKGKKVLKFGEMFWGLYPGGIAFSSKEEAKEFALQNKEFLDKFSNDWKIYKLSGDFLLDTKILSNQRYIKKSMYIQSIDSLK